MLRMEHLLTGDAAPKLLSDLYHAVSVIRFLLTCFYRSCLVLPSQPARVTKTCQNDVTGDAAPKSMLFLPLEWFIIDTSVFHSAILTIHNRDVSY